MTLRKQSLFVSRVGGAAGHVAAFLWHAEHQIEVLAGAVAHQLDIRAAPGMFRSEALCGGQPVDQLPGEMFEVILRRPSGAQRGVVGQPDPSLTKIVQAARSKPEGPVRRARASDHGAGTRVTGDVQLDAQMSVQLRQPPREELPRRFGYQIVYRNLTAPARARSAAVHQDSHRRGCAPAP